MSAIATLLYKYLRTTFSKLDWELGSVIRELVAQPIVKLAEYATATITSAYNKIDIAYLLEAPEENKEAIDTLFNDLGLATPSTTRSSGTVQILTTSYDDFAIPLNTVFTHDTISVVTNNTYKATLTPQESSDLQLHQIGVNAYAVEVPVVSVSDGVCLAVGAELEWSQLGTDIYEAKVYSAITGGVGAYTPTEKINLIRQQLFPESVTCAKSLLRTINKAIPDSVVDCVFAQNNGTASSDIYIKTTALPESWFVTAKSTAVDANTRKAIIDGTGINKVISVNGTSIDSTYVTHEGRSLIITYAGTTELAKIEVSGLKTAADIQTVLDNFTANTGTVFNVVVPRILQLSIVLPIGGDSLISSSINKITAAVNGSNIDPTNIGDNTLRATLAEQGSTLLAAGTYILTDISTGKTCSSLGSANVGQFTESKKPAVVYTASNLIGTTND